MNRFGKDNQRRDSFTDKRNRGASEYINVNPNQQNSWQNILNEVAQQDTVRDSHLLVLGNYNAGK